MKTYCAGPPAEQLEVGLDVLRRERDPVDDRVELRSAERLLHRGRVADVAAQHGHLGRQRSELWWRRG